VEEREEEAAAQARYYSTRAQLTELLEALDPDQYERELYENIISHREDFEVRVSCIELIEVINDHPCLSGSGFS
jgi:hypothetical protein